MAKKYLKPNTESVTLASVWSICGESVHSGAGTSGKEDPTPPTAPVVVPAPSRGVPTF